MNLFLLCLGVFVPFVGTALGSGAVFLWKKPMGIITQKIFFGFASGVMLAAAVWSLLIPAMEEGSALDGVAGVLSGVGLFLLGDLALQFFSRKKESDPCHGARMLAVAVTVHNLPEGMAVGVVFAGALASGTSLAPALVLAMGIAIQNFPEGAIISMPLAGVGMNKKKAFVWGTLSGAVEPIGAVLSLLLTAWVSPLLPFVLSFAAGAMLYVVVQELVPEIHGGKGEKAGVFATAVGFCLMMFLDVVLG